MQNEAYPLNVAILESGQPLLAPQARLLADRLGLPLVAEGGVDSFQLLLALTQSGLELRENLPQGAVVRVDFASGAAAYRSQPGRLAGELLAKAMGVSQAKPLSVVDATAGLGQDAFLLASLGCGVRAMERSSVTAALLRDGLERARLHPLAKAAAGRIEMVQADARDFLRQLASGQAAKADAIYLDPMFPPRGKERVVRKEMRLCRMLSGDDGDATELFALARLAAPRVVVKRLPHAPEMPEKPNRIVEGKAVRFDIYQR